MSFSMFGREVVWGSTTKFTCGPEAGDGHQGRSTEVDFRQLLVVVGTTVEGVGRAAHADVQQVAIHLPKKKHHCGVQ